MILALLPPVELPCGRALAGYNCTSEGKVGNQRPDCLGTLSSRSHRKTNTRSPSLHAPFLSPSPSISLSLSLSYTNFGWEISTRGYNEPHAIFMRSRITKLNHDSEDTNTMCDVIFCSGLFISKINVNLLISAMQKYKFVG